MLAVVYGFMLAVVSYALSYAGAVVSYPIVSWGVSYRIVSWFSILADLPLGHCNNEGTRVCTKPFPFRVGPFNQIKK
jgi:hypothetical protein